MLVSLKQSRKETPELSAHSFYRASSVSPSFHFSINNETKAYCNWDGKGLIVSIILCLLA